MDNPIPASGLDGFEPADPWLQLDGPIYPSTPRRFLEHIGYIRKASEWRASGFEISDTGNRIEPISEGGLTFGFRRLSWMKPHQVAALKHGKRALHTYIDVHAFLAAGGLASELLDLPEHIWAYHRAATADRAGDRALAIKEIRTAVELQPEEVRYRERDFAWRLEAGDISAVSQMVEFYRNDLCTAVHAGLAGAALRLQRKERGAAAAEALYNELCSGLSSSMTNPVQGRYSPQQPWFIEAKLVELSREWAKILKQRRTPETR